MAAQKFQIGDKVRYAGSGDTPGAMVGEIVGAAREGNQLDGAILYTVRFTDGEFRVWAGEEIELVPACTHFDQLGTTLSPGGMCHTCGNVLNADEIEHVRRGENINAPAKQPVWVIENDGEFHVIGDPSEPINTLELETLRDELDSYESTWSQLPEEVKALIRQIDSELADEAEEHSNRLSNHLYGAGGN